MIIKKFRFTFWALMLLIPAFASGQWERGQASVTLSLPQVALLDIEPDAVNSIHYMVQSSIESGSSPTVTKADNKDLWLNYTSALPPHLTSRTVMAEIADGILPTGIKVFLEVSAYSGTGKGIHGQPAGKIELAMQPKPIITGIGNSFTGDGEGSGHRINFSMEISDYAELKSNSESTFTLLYTLTDN